MRNVRLLAALLVAVGIPLAAAAPAGASLTGPCTASGSIGSTSYDPKVINDATIPRKGSVVWQGSVPGSGKRTIEGKVFVKLPPPIGEVKIGDWGGPSDTYANRGTYKYDFPSLLVGLKVPVAGHHTDRGFTCAGEVTVQLSGSRTSNPVLIASLVLTVISVVNVGLSVRAKRVAR